jgi:hypothetical protein
MKAGHMDIDLEEVEQLPELFKDAKRDARINRFIWMDEIEAILKDAPVVTFNQKDIMLAEVSRRFGKSDKQ